jgi:hypothetical protein
MATTASALVQYNSYHGVSTRSVQWLPPPSVADMLRYFAFLIVTQQHSGSPEIRRSFLTMHSVIRLDDATRQYRQPTSTVGP